MKIPPLNNSPDGLDVVVLDDESVWITQSSYSRFAGVTHATLSDRCKCLKTVEAVDVSEITYETFDCPSVIKTRHNNSDLVLVSSDIFGIWIMKDRPDLGRVMLVDGAARYLRSVIM